MDPPPAAPLPEVNPVPPLLTAAQHLSEVKVKLPPYLDADLDTWFLLVENRFRVSNIRSERRKYDLLVDSIPPTIAIEVRDLLQQPPENDPYNTLKSAILERAGVPFSERLRRVPF